jgi:hypothetical protein
VFPRLFAVAIPVLFAAPLWARSASRTLTQSTEPVTTAQTPGCEGTDAKACLNRAIEAMGGRERLAAIKTVHLDVLQHTKLVEQSYRQTPFITSYERDQVVIDHPGQRYLAKQHSVWPEADLKGADSDLTLVVTAQGGVYRVNGKDRACSGANLDAGQQALALGPETVLLTAAAADDLRYLDPETLRSTLHTVLGFTWKGIAVRIAINRFNHLPDAIETKQQFRDFWFYWGDVEERIYLDNWRLIDGVEYPSNQIVERNGVDWSSSQAVDIAFNAPIEAKDFVVDATAAAQSLKTKGWKREFRNDHTRQLAPGIDLYMSSWNTAIVKQPDGIVILETPISSKFTEGILAEAKKRYPDLTVKAVLSTSDSWPHVGGVRFDVAEGLPIYILDLNKPLLDRMAEAKHTIDPDPLEKSRKAPDWRIVSGETEIGTGENRMVLYPLRGASTERQYMVYFPGHHLLYASDTLSMNDDHTLYDPELMHEVKQAVEREHLVVDTVWAMHEGPTPWSQILALLEKAEETDHTKAAS